jgi:hypothetical protein
VRAAPAGLGVGQGWVDLSGSRALGVTYTNTTGKPIQISAGFNKSTASPVFTIDGLDTLDGPRGFTNDRTTWFGIVPDGITYSASNVTSVGTWLELR